MRNYVATAMAVSVLSLSACASGSHQIEAKQADFSKYANMTCTELEAELIGSADRLMRANLAQDKQADNDVMITGLAILLFPPIALAAAGDNGEPEELALRKGEFEAVEKVALEADCQLKEKVASRRAEIDAYYEMRKSRYSDEQS